MICFFFFLFSSCVLCANTCISYSYLLSSKYGAKRKKMEIHIFLNCRRLLREYDSWKSKSQALNIFSLLQTLSIYGNSVSRCVYISEVHIGSKRVKKARKNNKQWTCMHTFTYRNYENPYTYHVARQIQYDKYR